MIRQMREFADGSTAMVRGALDAGCTFFAGYPITPASPILMMMMRELPKVGGVAIQGEDEIASIGMCIGAAMAGARAMTATSGPGISLYSENIGLALMGEVPLVIVDVQRMGPATGGATTTAQGDIQFARWGTAGGYPIIALAPSSVAECYGLTRRAFALARRFRSPVFVLTDKELNMTSTTVDVEAYRRVDGDPEGAHDAERPAAGEPEAGGGTFTPYRYDPLDGVPPMVHYGDGELLRFTGSTHDEGAFITKDPQTVNRLNRHLAEKIEAHRDEIELVAADLETDAQTLLVSFGITAGAMREAVRAARHDGRKVSAVTVHSLWPVPETALRNAMRSVERVVVAELNLGQYRREIERIGDGREIVGLNRVDGELIAPEQFLEVIR
jgi:2-oxoglutarate ferredoxin oxidoreductase subunit alpha